MTSIVATEQSEWSPKYRGWRVLAASVVGMALSPGPLFWGTMGLFVASFQMEFGWERAEIMLALTWVTISSIPAMPTVGRLIDNLGTRRVLLPSIVLLALILFSIPMLLNSLLSLYVLFFLAGLLTVGTQSISYIRVLASWFDRHRGIAIGITASGIGVGYAALPPLVQWAIATSGWHGGYFVMAGVVLVVSLPIMYLLIHNEPSAQVESVSLGEAPVSPPGKSLGEALRVREFWVILVGILIVATAFNAILPTIVPMLSDRGMPRESAVFAVTVMGLAMAISRIAVGFLIDRFFAPIIACGVFLLATVGLGLLSTGLTGSSAYVAAFLIGLGFGAETDLMGFLVTRYFGLKHFGQIYGVILGAFLVGTGAGPFLLNLVYDLTGSYSPALYTGTAVGAIAAIGFLLLRKYPNLKGENA